jgi:hypothetical protein
MSALDFPIADRDGEAEYLWHLLLAAEYPFEYVNDVRAGVC